MLIIPRVRSGSAAAGGESLKCQLYQRVAEEPFLLAPAQTGEHVAYRGLFPGDPLNNLIVTAGVHEALRYTGLLEDCRLRGAPGLAAHCLTDRQEHGCRLTGFLVHKVHDFGAQGKLEPFLFLVEITPNRPGSPKKQAHLGQDHAEYSN